MRADARAGLRARVSNWAAVLRVKPNQIRIQAMTHKWGSCSTSGWVTFSLDLTGRTKSFQDFIIVHELLHLRIRNHGKLFSATLRAHLPENPWAKTQGVEVPVRPNRVGR